MRRDPECLELVVSGSDLDARDTTGRAAADWLVEGHPGSERCGEILAAHRLAREESVVLDKAATHAMGGKKAIPKRM